MRKYIFLSLIALGSVSCTDDFLEEKMVSTITQDYFNTEQGLEQLVVGTYDALRITKQYQQGPFAFFSGVDNMVVKSANYAIYSGSVWNSTGNEASWTNQLCGEYTSNQMLGFYPCINNCNRVISSIQNKTVDGKFTSDQEYADQRMAEAMFNRAYCIYLMNTLLGDVYVPDGYTTALPSNYAYKRESSENLYKKMIGDLRYCFEKLPSAAELASSDYGRATKGAAAHFLAKLYLLRALGAEYGTSEYGRNADGTIDNANPNSYLGMLYKGQGTADLDSCIYYTNYVIDQDGYYSLEADYGKLFSHPLDDYSNESSREIILACVYGMPANSGTNGRYGNRLPYFLTPNYTSASWGIPDFTWEYPGKGNGHSVSPSDFGYDVFTDKQADSRFQKSFYLEYHTSLRGGSSTSTPAEDLDYYAYNDENNQTYKWTEAMANYFNSNILPTYNRASWNGRQAVAGEHKMGTGDLAFAYLENTKETAIDIDEALAQPFVLIARWIKDGNKYYYRAPIQAADGGSYTYNSLSYVGLNKVSATGSPTTSKYTDPNRNSYDSYYSSRDVPLFRLAETYLMRAMAKGLKGEDPLPDINMVRHRAAFKTTDTRNEVLARLYPGNENLTESERSWPYQVETDMTSAMTADASYWTGGVHAEAENYPPTATSTEDRFVNFILNEIAREANTEFIYYEWLHHSGWQADRIMYHDQVGSSMTGLWDSADNLLNGTGPTGDGLGSFQPAYTLKPFAQTFLDLLTDENGAVLDDAGKKAYQNYGY